MKFVIAVFRHIFTPLALVLAVLAGLLAAATSALIEYHVLQEWLRPEGTGLLFLPLIIVTALEGFCISSAPPLRKTASRKASNRS